MIDTLHDLLLEYGRAHGSDSQRSVEEEIWNQFGAELSVLIWDMSGFSLLTRRHGIVHYLSLVRRMQEITRPIVHDHQGSLVKFEADNGFAVFPKPKFGIEAALAMMAAFEEENTKYPEEFDIRVSCGIDHGRIILLDGQDFFGDAVNIASKLGEDLANPGEILVASTAMKALSSNESYSGKLISFSVSGLGLEAVRIDSRASSPR